LLRYGLSRVEVSAPAVDKYGGFEVLSIAIATYSSVDSHDLAVDAFNDSTGKPVGAIVNNLR
jgi:hypothetical protein